MGLFFNIDFLIMDKSTFRRQIRCYKSDILQQLLENIKKSKKNIDIF